MTDPNAPPLYNVTYYLAPDIGAVMEEIFERAGVDPVGISNQHIQSALRSMRLMLNSEWLTLGFRTWMFQLFTLTTSVGVATVVLPSNVLAVSDAVLIRSNRATPINPMSRNEWLEIPDKTELGRPDRYFCDRQYNQVQMTVWRSPENNTDQIQYWGFVNPSQPGNSLIYGLQMPPHVLEAFHAGMAARMAQKFNPMRYAELQIAYRGGDPNPRNVGGALALALDADRPFGDVRFTFARRRR